MLFRIVKMTFRPESVARFTAIFEERKALIAGFEGCAGVELLQDINQPNIFFTYSKWVNEESLERYRNSELFTTTWNEVKTLFGDKPEAWSTQQL